MEGKKEGERDRGMEQKKDRGRPEERESNHRSIAQIK